jgi:hypothetical protein
MYAAKGDHAAVVKLLLERGADRAVSPERRRRRVFLVHRVVVRARRRRRRDIDTAAEAAAGRGLHSSTIQLNLGRF